MAIVKKILNSIPSWNPFFKFLAKFFAYSLSAYKYIDEQHKKEKEIQLVGDDIDQLKGEVEDCNKEEGGKGFNFNRYWRNSKRIKLTYTTVRVLACNFFFSSTDLPVIALCSVSTMQTFIGWHLRSRDDIYLLLYKDQLSVQN